MKRKAAVLGASGFTGGELVRLLSGHPGLEPAWMGAHSKAGAVLSAVIPGLATGGVRLLPTLECARMPADVCFSCLPGGELHALVDDIEAPLIVDLSDDMRAAAFSGDIWTYGLTEFARKNVLDADRIANPGCYPTASLLSLVPFARAGMLGDSIVIDAVSGYSGAGRSERDHLSLAVGDSSVGAYGTTDHRHVPEIEAGLHAFGGAELKVSFTPHLVPMARGLLVTARFRAGSLPSDEDVKAVLMGEYENEPFVDVSDDWPATKWTHGSNRAVVHARVDRRAGWVIVSCAIDNLGKGAAGQALQNANLALGLDEGQGLSPSGVWP